MPEYLFAQNAHNRAFNGDSPIYDPVKVILERLEVATRCCH